MATWIFRFTNIPTKREKLLQTDGCEAGVSVSCLLDNPLDNMSVSGDYCLLIQAVLQS